MSAGGIVLVVVATRVLVVDFWSAYNRPLLPLAFSFETYSLDWRGRRVVT
jgi:hypothetical protein